MKSQSAAFTGSIPQDYETYLGPVIFQDYALRMAERAAGYAPGRVLETAAGTGIVTRALRDLLPRQCEIIATDLNAAMLEVAKTKFSAQEAVSFEAVDATDLPYGEAAFDLAVCQFGIMFFPDRRKAFSEMRRVLSPSGHFLLSVWDSHRFNRFGAIAHKMVGEFFPDDPPQFYQVPFSCHAIDPIKTDLLDAGFRQIRMIVEPINKVVPRACDFARGIIYGNPLLEQVRVRGGDPDAIRAAITVALNEEFGPDPFAMPLQTISFDAA